MEWPPHQSGAQVRGPGVHQLDALLTVCQHIFSFSLRARTTSVKLPLTAVTRVTEPGKPDTAMKITFSRLDSRPRRGCQRIWADYTVENARSILLSSSAGLLLSLLLLKLS